MSDMTRGWEKVQRFADLQVGDQARLVRPETNLRERYPDDPDDMNLIPRAEFEGTVQKVNPRGQLWLEGYPCSFLEDAVHGDWFYEVYREAGA